MFGPYAQTKGRGFSGFPVRPAAADPIGSVVYASTLPDSNYLLADGSSVKAASYPELARKWGQAAGYNNRKIADPATLPSSSTAAYCSAISPDGKYVAIAANASSDVLVYQVTDAGLVYLQTLSLNGGVNAHLAGPEAMAFSADSSYLACGNDYAPFLYIFRRAPGATAFTNTPLTLTGIVLNAVPTAIEFTEDNALLAGYGNSSYGYAGVWLLSGSTATRLGSSPFPGALEADIRQITRNLAGTKFAFRMNNAPYIRFYDYAGSGVFSPSTGTLPTASSTTFSICLSPSGDYFMLLAAMTGLPTNVIQIWKRDSTGAYAFKGVMPSATADSGMSFTPDERQFQAGRTTLLNAVYQPANGQFLELARNAAVGNFPSALKRVQARNGKATLYVGNLSPYISVYLDGPLMPDIPLPAYPVLGSGGNILKPYIKVK